MEATQTHDDLAEMQHMSSADRLIYCLRKAVAEGGIPDLHFGELVANIAASSRRSEKHAEILGSTIITERQRDIVRNLREQLIGDTSALVFDIGANEGWFLEQFLDSKFSGQVIAFEPSSANQPALNSISNTEDRVEIVQAAVGDSTGHTVLNVCESLTGLSSILPFTSGYHFFNPDFEQGKQSQETVRCTTLDDYWSSRKDLEKFNRVFLKVDTQGFETQVIEGAKSLISSGRVKAILIEMMTVPKYDGAETYDQILDRLHGYGFYIYDMLPFYREIDMNFQPRARGQLTEFDCLLVHEDYLPRQAGSKTASI